MTIWASDSLITYLRCELSQVIPKDAESAKALEDIMNKNVLFAHLDDDEKKWAMQHY